MILVARDGTRLNSDHIESYSSPYSVRPLFEVTMTSGAKHIISWDELGKAFPDI